MLYAGVAMMFMMASCYLLFRRGNAFSPDITSSVRLRRVTAAFFAAMVLNHVWYLPVAYSTSRDDAMMRYLFGGLLDSMTVLPLSIIVLLTMLQDRRRPLWPVGLMVAPFVVGMAVCVFRGNDALWPALNVYLLLMGIGFTIYMVFAVRQYGRWLRDKYFSRQGTTYNAYINGLRVNHFVSLYHEAVATHSPIITKQLAHDSGYRCYSTFSLAFKQLLGQNVTAWMRDTAKSI